MTVFFLGSLMESPRCGMGQKFWLVCRKIREGAAAHVTWGRSDLTCQMPKPPDQSTNQPDMGPLFFGLATSSEVNPDCCPSTYEATYHLL